MSELIETLDQVVDRFDAFLVDQFGVLLTGGGAYPFAPATLQRLASSGKRIILLSNSGQRSEPNNKRLVNCGFDRDSFDHVLSSGEAAYGYLQDKISTAPVSETRVLLISSRGDKSAIKGLNLTPTEKPEQADLVILAGCDGDGRTLDDYRDLLQEPAGRDVPCLCTNPDMIRLTADGSDFGTGEIAKYYQSLGGTVDWVGKPYQLIYDMAYERLNRPDRNRVLCIGDSPAHDIVGGKKAGFATALVRTGIYANASDAQVAAKCQKLKAVPDIILPAFV